MSDLDTLHAQRDQAAADALAAEQTVAAAAFALVSAQQDHSQARAALADAQNAAASADLDYGNAIRAAERAAIAKAYNIQLAKENPLRREQMLKAGIITKEDLTDG